MTYPQESDKSLCVQKIHADVPNCLIGNQHQPPYSSSWVISASTQSNSPVVMRVSQ